MPNATFRIDGISIEGFKAFAKRQNFQFDGRHVFLFGPNGSGKTSIIEAIRWCLFGLASRRGEIVRNQFYAGGPCIVELKLAALDGHWTLQRRLRQSGGESDLTVRDPNGAERNLEDVFPQLSRIGPSEGTHVIYAAQQPSSRRPEADITDFRYVVYRYLGLEEIPRLSDVLLGLSRDWQIQEQEICEAVDSLGERISQRITEIDDSLSRINAAPPWGSGLTPTTVDTNGKITELALDAGSFGATISSDELNNLDSDGKLYEIDTAINLYFSGGMTGLRQKLSERSDRQKAANSSLLGAQSTVNFIAEQTAELRTLKSELASTLRGLEIEELEEKLELIESDLEATQLRLGVVQATSRFLDVHENEDSSGSCPACDTAVEIDQMKLRIAELQVTGDHRTKQILEQKDQLRSRVSLAQRLAIRRTEIEQEIAQYKIDLTKIIEKAILEFDLPAESSVELLAEYVDELRKGCEELKAAIDSESESKRSWDARIEDLRQELRFQHLRSLKVRLANLHSGRYVPLHESLKDLSEMRDIADKTRELLNSQLKERLDEDLPPVAREMTDVYLRLTETPIFDSISIHQGENQDGGTTLDLRVSSSRGPGNWGVEHGILNGQALNAIQLVPYFVFSRYQEGPLLDLLLLDDPTQAFDPKKIKLLLSELHAAASHATLFVATHEEDRFIPVLKEIFDGSEFKAYRSLGLGADGPRFEDVPFNL